MLNILKALITLALVSSPLLHSQDAKNLTPRDTDWQPLYSGVDYRYKVESLPTAYTGINNSPDTTAYHILRVDLSNPDVSVKTAQPENLETGVMTQKKTATFLKETKAKIAMNGTPDISHSSPREGSKVSAYGLAVSGGVQFSAWEDHHPYNQGFDYALVIKKDGTAAVIHKKDHHKIKDSVQEAIAARGEPLLYNGKTQEINHYYRDYSRLAVGISRDGNTLFIVSCEVNDVPKMANTLQELGCYSGIALAHHIPAHNLALENIDGEALLLSNGMPSASHIGVYSAELSNSAATKTFKLIEDNINEINKFKATSSKPALYQMTTPVSDQSHIALSLNDDRIQLATMKPSDENLYTSIFKDESKNEYWKKAYNDNTSAANALITNKVLKLFLGDSVAECKLSDDGTVLFRHQPINNHLDDNEIEDAYDKQTPYIALINEIFGLGYDSSWTFRLDENDDLQPLLAEHANAFNYAPTTDPISQYGFTLNTYDGAQALSISSGLDLVQEALDSVLSIPNHAIEATFNNAVNELIQQGFDIDKDAYHQLLPQLLERKQKMANFAQRLKSDKRIIAIDRILRDPDCDIKAQLAEIQIDINTIINGEGSTLFHLALQNKNLALASKLLKLGADINQLAEKPCTEGSNYVHDNSHSRNALFIGGYYESDDETIDFLLENGIDVNKKINGAPAYFSLLSDRVDIFDKLVDAGADLSLINDEGASIFEVIPSCNLSPRSVKYILKKYLTDDRISLITNKDEFIFHATKFGLTDIINKVIDLGGNPIGFEQSHKNALHIAVEKCYVQLAQRFLQLPNVKEFLKNGASGHSSILSSTSDLKMVKLLIDNGAHVTTESLKQAITHDNTESLNLLLSNIDPKVINDCDWDWNCPIHEAITQNKPEFVRTLISHGAKTSKRALKNAVSDPKNNPAVITALSLSPELDLTEKYSWNDTIAGNALRAKNYEILTTLIERGAEFSTSDFSNALDENNARHIDLIINSKGFRENKLHHEKERLIGRFLFNGNFDAIKHLSDQGVQLDNGDSALHFLIDSHHRGQYIESEDLLKKVKAAAEALNIPLTVKASNGKSLLHAAANGSKSTHLVQYLLDQGLDPLESDTDGHSAFWYATETRFDDAARLISDKYAGSEPFVKHVNDILQNYITFNRFYIDSYIIQRIAILIKSGGDFTKKFNTGKTILEYAIENSDNILLDAIFMRTEINDHLATIDTDKVAYYGARSGNTVLLTKLLDLGKSLHPALAKCTRENHIQGVTILLELGIDPHTNNNEAINAITSAPMAKLYKKHGAKFDDKAFIIKAELQTAIKNKDEKEFVSLVEKHAHYLQPEDHQKVFLSQSAPMIHAIIEHTPKLQKTLLVGMSKYTFMFSDGVIDFLKHRIQKHGEGYIIALSRRIVKDEFIMKHLSGIVNPGNGDSFPRNKEFKLKDLKNMRVSEKLYQDAITYAKKHAVPYLGVCSGSQHLVLNSDGSLRTVNEHHTMAADIHLNPGSMAHFLSLSPEEQALALNQCALQPVIAKNAKIAHSYCAVKDKLGNNIKLGGLSQYGPVEAFTLDGLFIGVQYHPERAYFRTVQGTNRQKAILDGYFDLILAYHKSKQYALRKDIPLPVFKSAFREARKTLDNALEACITPPSLQRITFIWGNHGSATIAPDHLHGTTLSLMTGITPDDLNISIDNTDILFHHNDHTLRITNGLNTDIFVKFPDGSGFHLNEVQNQSHIADSITGLLTKIKHFNLPTNP